ncbi:MAG: hypothetical protein ACP5HM_03990 [Anaerolineae bacterium]
MIDWWGVFSNSLWVLGLSVLLAAWSMAYYDARRTNRKTLQLLGEGAYSWAVTVGLMLFCAGLALTEDRLWAQILWGVLGLAFLVDQVLRWQNAKTTASDDEVDM